MTDDRINFKSAGVVPRNRVARGEVVPMNQVPKGWDYAGGPTDAEATKTFNEFAHEYRPYDTMPAFMEGAEAYMERRYNNPYGVDQGLRAQAWDRGRECAMRFTRQHGRYA